MKREPGMQPQSSGAMHVPCPEQTFGEVEGTAEQEKFAQFDPLYPEKQEQRLGATHAP